MKKSKEVIILTLICAIQTVWIIGKSLPTGFLSAGKTQAQDSEVAQNDNYSDPAYPETFTEQYIYPTSTPVPTATTPQIFSYTPLPVYRGGPGNDIEEVAFGASRYSAQVDDYITFTVTLKNIAPYNKRIIEMCFESTDGNFGCLRNINLAPGETYTSNNLGRWTSGGNKNIWIKWSQDEINYYQPVHSKTLHVNIIG